MNGTPPPPARQQAPDPDAYPLLSVDDLERLPPPEFILDDLLPQGGFSVLYGPSGAGKSFLALDWSLCIASGAAWWGQQTKPGWVLYIAAEGRAGLGIRVAAWRTARPDLPLERIRFLPDAVNLRDRPQIIRAHRTIATLPEPPALIVVDTMARAMPGGDENSAKDVGELIAHTDRLRGTAAVLLVHHTGKNGDDERGSSALRGAADMMHALQKDGANLKLKCSKSKDTEEYDPWQLHLSPVAKSCVLRVGTDDSKLSPAEQRILDEVSESFGTDGATGTQLRDASQVPKSSFYRALNALVDRGLLARAGQRYTAVPASPRQSHETGPSSLSHRSPIGTVGPGLPTDEGGGRLL